MALGRCSLGDRESGGPERVCSWKYFGNKLQVISWLVEEMEGVMLEWQ